MINEYQIQHISYSYRLSYVHSMFFPHRFRISVSFSGAGAYVPTFSPFAYICDEADRTSPLAGHRAGPPRVPSRHTGTVTEVENEKVHFESRKGPRRTESARLSLLQPYDFAVHTFIYMRRITYLYVENPPIYLCVEC